MGHFDQPDLCVLERNGATWFRAVNGTEGDDASIRAEN
jgi:hypothetical protein